MRDTDGDHIPDRLWHGGRLHESASVLPARTQRWWNAMDHDRFLDPPDLDDDADARHELDFELRTAYGNIVYDALLHSDDVDLKALAERYGEVCEIDPAADGVIAIVKDGNVLQANCWMLVLRSGTPIPTAAPGAHLGRTP